jgi:flagellar biogenesis protein FliO
LTVLAVLGLIVTSAACAGPTWVIAAQAADSPRRGRTSGGLADSDAVEADSRTIPPRSSDTARKTTGKTDRARQPSKIPDGGWWTTLGGLVAVLALIFLCAKILKKGVPAAQRTLPAEVIEILGRKALDYRHTVHLVRFGSRMLMIGTSQEGMTTLSEVTDQAEIDFLAGLCKPSESASVAQSFQQLFQRFQSPEPARPEAPAPIAREAERVSVHEDEFDATDSDPAILRLQERLQKAQRADASSRSDPKTGGGPQATEAGG